MRKLMIILAVFVVLATLFGCGGSRTIQKTTNDSDVPDFVLNPPQEAGYLFGTGIAEQVSLQLAKEVADNRAKKEIANTLSLKIKAMLSDALGQAAVGKESDATEFVESVSKAFSEGNVSGCVIEKREYKNGKMYSLAKYPLDEAAQSYVKSSVKAYVPSTNAQYDRAWGEKALEKLDADFEKISSETHQ